MMQLGLGWDKETPEYEILRCRLWQRNTRGALMWEMQGAYQNYCDADLVDYMHDYYGPNAYKLQLIKTKYDPENVFAFEQSIPRL